MAMSPEDEFSPEQFAEWLAEGHRIIDGRDKPGLLAAYVARKANQHGFEIGVGRSIEWLIKSRITTKDKLIEQLRADLLPPPPSLKARALAILDKPRVKWTLEEEQVVRLALESIHGQ